MKPRSRARSRGPLFKRCPGWFERSEDEVTQSQRFLCGGVLLLVTRSTDALQIEVQATEVQAFKHVREKHVYRAAADHGFLLIVGVETICRVSTPSMTASAAMSILSDCGWSWVHFLSGVIGPRWTEDGPFNKFSHAK